MKKDYIINFTKDRHGLVLAIASIVFALIVSGFILAWLRPSDVQIPIRYSGFRVNDLDGTYYNERWYERISFLVFVLLQTVSAIWLAITMHTQRLVVLGNFLLAFSIFINSALVVIVFFITRTVTL